MYAITYVWQKPTTTRCDTQRISTLDAVEVTSQNGDVAIISMHVLKVGTSSVQSRYEIRRKNDGLLSFTADITTVFMDLDAKKAIPLPDDFRVIFERLLAA